MESISALHGYFDRIHQLLFVAAVSTIFNFFLVSTFQKRTTRQFILCVIAETALLIAGIHEAIVVAQCVHFGWIASALGTIWLNVFALGGLLSCSQDITYSEAGQLLISKSSFAYKLIYCWGELDPTIERSLCGISWMTVLSLLVFTPAAVAFKTICWVVGIGFFTLKALAQGREPISDWKWFFSDGKMYPPVHYWGGYKGIPFTPIPWLILAVWIHHLHDTKRVYGVLLSCLLGIAVIALLIWVYTKIVNWEKKNYQSFTGEEPEFSWEYSRKRFEIREQLWRRTSLGKGCHSIGNVIALVRGKFCPVLVVDPDPIRNNNKRLPNGGDS